MTEEEEKEQDQIYEDHMNDNDHFNAGGSASTCPSDLRRERAALVSPKASNAGGR